MIGPEVCFRMIAGKYLVRYILRKDEAVVESLNKLAIVIKF